MGIRASRHLKCFQVILFINAKKLTNFHHSNNFLIILGVSTCFCEEERMGIKQSKKKKAFFINIISNGFVFVQQDL